MENKKRLAHLGLDLTAQSTDKRRYPALVVLVVKVCITQKAEGFWLALACCGIALAERPRHLVTGIRYSATLTPEPPISFGKSFNFGKPSLIRSLVS